MHGHYRDSEGVRSSRVAIKRSSTVYCMMEPMNNISLMVKNTLLANFIRQYYNDRYQTVVAIGGVSIVYMYMHVSPIVQYHHKFHYIIYVSLLEYCIAS